MAEETRFQITDKSRIDGYSYVLGFFLMVLDGMNTLNKWAEKIEVLVWLTLFYAKWFMWFLFAVFKQTGKYLSPIRFADFIKEYFEQLWHPD